MKCLRLLWVVLPFSLYVTAEELNNPMFLNLQPVSGDNASSLLHGECDQLTDDHIRCHFTHVYISNKGAKERELEELLSRIDSAKDSEFDPNWVDAMNCSEAFASAIEERFKNVNTAIQKKLYAQFKEVQRLCPIDTVSKAKQSIKMLMTAIEYLDNNTCSLSMSSMDREFKAIRSSGSSYWQYKYEHEPNPCGKFYTITLSPIRGGLGWEYKQQFIVTMPDNKYDGSNSCADINREVQVYSSFGEGVYKSCQIINLGW